MKTKILLLPLVLSVVMVLSGCQVSKPSSNEVSTDQLPKAEIPQYIISAELDTNSKTLTATQTVQYTNNESKDLSELYFHLYPNAYIQKDTAPFLSEELNEIYPNGFVPGYIEVTEISQLEDSGNTPLGFDVLGDGRTILKIALPKKLEKNQTIVVQIKYVEKIPPASERFGYGENHFNMGNWYPILAVYDQDGWNLDKYYAIGDPFYSDCANYDVTVSLPTEYIMAASGDFIEKKEKDAMSIWHFIANNMRDFAFVANKAFEVASVKVGETTINSYFYNDDETKGNQALEVAQKAMILFNQKYGQYPYNTFSVVETPFSNGMEYPGLVYISDSLYKNSAEEEDFILTVAHETAHQWWYGLVGNNPIKEAWLDESLSTYSEVVYMENEENKGDALDYMEYIAQESEQAISGGSFDGVVLKPLDEFKNWDDYETAVYSTGTLIFRDLRKQVGDEVFFKIMQSYFSEFEYKIATTDDFIAVCEKVSGKDLQDFFKNRLGYEEL